MARLGIPGWNTSSNDLLQDRGIRIEGYARIPGSG